MSSDPLQKLRAGLKNAFALDPASPLTDHDRQLLARLANAIIARGMPLPAILFLGSLEPLGSIGSQAMVFLRPFLAGIAATDDYDRLAAILDRRDGIQELIHAIERSDVQAANPAGKDRPS